MRILHTADWHLGRSFHRVGLDETQRAGLQEILDLIDQHQVEVLIVAGDIYDRAVPSADAVRNYDWMIQQLVQRNVTAVISSGNHDSAQRLGVARAATAAAGIHLFTSLDQLTQPVEMTVQGAAAPLCIYAIPYLDPRAYSAVLDAPMNHQGVIQEATDRIRQDLAQRREDLPQTQALCVAHLFAQGGSASESEKPIVVGGVETVTADVIDGFSYTALGHLHRPQRVAAREHVRYSGSLTKFSFSEVTNTNQVVLVEYAADERGAPEVQDITTLPLHSQLPMAVLEGDFDQLSAPDQVEKYRDHYLQVTLIQDEPPLEAHRQLRSLYPRMLEFRRQRLNPVAPVPQQDYRTQFGGATTDEQLCELFYTHVSGREYGPEIQALFTAAVERARATQE